MTGVGKWREELDAAEAALSQQRVELARELREVDRALTKVRHALAVLDGKPAGRIVGRREGTAYADWRVSERMIIKARAFLAKRRKPISVKDAAALLPESDEMIRRAFNALVERGEATTDSGGNRGATRWRLIRDER